MTDGCWEESGWKEVGDAHHARLKNWYKDWYPVTKRQLAFTSNA